MGRGGTIITFAASSPLPSFWIASKKGAFVVKLCLGQRKIKIRKSGDQPQLPNHRHTRFDHACAAPRAGRYSDKSDRFVNVLLKQQVENTLHRARIAVVVFRSNDDKTVGADDGVAPRREKIGDLGSIMVVRQVEVTNVE